MSSRSHCMSAPAMNTLPSSAYSGPAPGPEAAMVVMRLFVERHASPPVCMSRKQPVPYVFFAWPGWKQHCPNRAACWSPATPQMGTFGTMPAEAVRPNSPDEGSTSGSRDSGMSNRSSSHGSQRSSWMLYSMVRLAFVTSVACPLPWARAFHVVEDPLDLAGGEVGVGHEARLVGDDARRLRVGRQLVDDGGRAAALPHDGVHHGLPRFAVPHHGGLALVRDADAVDVLCAQVVRHPAGLGVDLRERVLHRIDDASVRVDEHGARRGGTLVERYDVLWHACSSIQPTTSV